MFQKRQVAFKTFFLANDHSRHIVGQEWELCEETTVLRTMHPIVYIHDFSGLKNNYRKMLHM
jgi:hypothetical protein